ncbi:hypothetical protein ACFT38_27935 [Streptomyces sp. NPDC056975]|uniref:hypothetical protein n=1 Tax=Streptomyces sp. NPDC056975 TaxID=3345985 RepID=UPI00362B08EF
MSDVKRLLGDHAQAGASGNPQKDPSAPGCPAYGRLGKSFDMHITYYEPTKGFGFSLLEWITKNEGDTQNLEDLRKCSKERAGGENINIRVNRATGGPGNVDGSIDSDRWKYNVRARVVDGVNVVIVTDAHGDPNGKTADEAISVAVARYGGTSLPKGYAK